MFSHDSVAARKTAAYSYNAYCIGIVMFHSKTCFTTKTSQFTMNWNRPCYSYQLDMFIQYVQISLRKRHKNSTSYLKLFWRYSRKTWGVDENNPLATKRVKLHKCIILVFDSSITCDLTDENASVLCLWKLLWLSFCFADLCGSKR